MQTLHVLSPRQESRRSAPTAGEEEAEEVSINALRAFAEKTIANSVADGFADCANKNTALGPELLLRAWVRGVVTAAIAKMGERQALQTLRDAFELIDRERKK